MSVMEILRWPRATRAKMELSLMRSTAGTEVPDVT